jgi:hypothetical protein
MRVERVGQGPIVHPGLFPALGENINGPSLVRAPEGAPARYFLYFAHHEGTHVRLAMADRLEGPWRIREGGVLDLAETWFTRTRPDVPQPDWAVSRGVDGLYPHIASPEVHRRGEGLVMWFHGMCADGVQRTAEARSADGLRWEVRPGAVSETTYLRVFLHRGRTYALARGGEVLARRRDGTFEGGHWPFDPAHRHAGLLLRGDTLHVVWTRIGDAPERILHSTIDLRGDWRGWRARGARELLRPERPWEGVEAPVVPTPVGGAKGPENGLRDPFLFDEPDGTLWMVYAGAGESNLCLARVVSGP